MLVLKDIGIATGKRAQIVLGAAVMDDLLGILFLVFVYDYISTGDTLGLFQIESAGMQDLAKKL